MPRIIRNLSSGDKLLYAWFSAMHTRVDMILMTGNAITNLEIIENEISQKISGIEKMTNYFDSESELSYLNDNAANRPIKMSDTINDIISRCIKYNERTQGLFDISISSHNYEHNMLKGIHISQDGYLFFDNHNVRIDLSGIIKGYTLDEIHGILRHHQIENALINLGNSSILAIGNHYRQEGWEISLKGLENGDDIPVILHNECLTVSGNNTLERKHIINPGTGKYIEGCKEVAVITDNATDGEVLSTSLFIADEKLEKMLFRAFHIKKIIHSNHRET